MNSPFFRVGLALLAASSTSLSGLTWQAQSAPPTKAVQTVPHPVKFPAEAKAGSPAPAATGGSMASPPIINPSTPDLQQPPASADAGLSAAVPLKIVLTPSESPLKLGSTSNIAADILNISNRPVEIDTTTVELMTNAILSKTDTLCVLPLTPTTNTTLIGPVELQPQDHIDLLFNLSQNKMYYTDNEMAAIRQYNQLAQSAPSGPMGVPPSQQDSHTVTANYQRALQDSYQRSCDPTFFGPIKRALDFSPGEYEYILTGKFSICDSASLLGCTYPSRPFVQSASFQVGIDQTQIILFAIVGGLLAYLVVTVRSDDGPINQFFALVTSEAGLSGISKAFTREGLFLVFKITRDLIGTAILSASFTIVSSRLSDTQFPIKISVLDVWGAITIGFLSYFAGNKFIDTLRKMVE
jgi:hypothetical protein